MMKSWKLLLGVKESNKEEEFESSFSGSSEEEEGELSFLGVSEEEEGEQGSGLIVIKKDLDPDFLLKIHLMPISFSPEVSFLE